MYTSYVTRMLTSGQQPLPHFFVNVVEPTVAITENYLVFLFVICYLLISLACDDN